jgi:hypothetical protein
MTRTLSFNPWLAAVAVALCVQFPAQAQERFTLSMPGVSDNRLFTSVAASDANGCGGKNQSPALSWNAGPAGTLSYAIVMHDPDGQKGLGVDHWIHYGIKAATRGRYQQQRHGWLHRALPAGRRQLSPLHHPVVRLGPGAGRVAGRPDSRAADGKNQRACAEKQQRGAALSPLKIFQRS